VGHAALGDRVAQRGHNALGGFGRHRGLVIDDYELRAAEAFVNH
jgi:hypothetical protein